MRKLFCLIAVLTAVVAFCGICSSQDKALAPASAASLPEGLSRGEGSALDLAIEEQGRALSQAEAGRSELFAMLSGMDEQASALTLQAAAYNNNLASDKTSSRDLEDIRDGEQSALESLDESISELSRRSQALAKSLSAAQKQAELFKKQATEAAAGQTAEKARGLAETAQKALVVWREMDQALAKRIASLEALRAAYAELGDQVLSQLRTKKRDELFEKSAGPGHEVYDAFSREIGALFNAPSSIADWEAWSGRQPGAKLSAPALGTLLVLVFAALQAVLLRVRRALIKIEEAPSCSLLPWRCFFLRTLYAPLPLTGAVIFLLAASQVPKLVFLFPPLPALFSLAAIALFLRWAFLLSPVLEKPDLPETKKLSGLARVLAAACGLAAVLHVTITAIIGPDAQLAALVRYGLSLFLLFWAMAFARADRRVKDPGRFPHFTRYLASLAPYFLGGLALLAVSLNLSGYGLLSAYVLASAAKATVAMGFGLLLFAVLREARQDEDGAAAKKRKPYKWAILRLSWILWFFLLLFAGLHSFDASLSVYEAIFRVLRQTVTVGRIAFSLMGAIFFVLILLVTRVLTGVFRHLFSERVLAGSGMETGLKESLTTLVSYFIWGVGILFALGALGISTTSLAVAMGGLSLGLGFGLQNIFNNFISGLILLFERPIQVGDNVEVNGTLGVVRRINVRATLVQTFDNASLIIPNSEFISSQVTNWSFKDPRVRRNLSLGVAYGSDVELVRSTLIEAAEKNPRVMNTPKPDVLFMDFADSALIFRLRFWCHVDAFFSVESELRFTIDRLFRERGIVIPFPQRDVHIINAKEKNDHEASD